ncbi:MAG: DUF1932 domain-containing protein [Gammaproteobacteria bacterium]
MPFQTIAIIGTGDMGSAVGRVLSEHGYRVITSLDGRSGHSSRLAGGAGIEDAGDLSNVVGQADVLLSIMPPAAAEGFAHSAAAAMAGQTPLLYVECNAISPARSMRIGAAVTEAGGRYVDGGIIGAAPGISDQPPRFYVSGIETDALLELNGKGIEVVSMGGEIGRASAIKMTFAALTKGTNALRTAVLLAGEKLAVGRELREEFRYRLPEEYERMERRVPYLAADAERWHGEMREIEDTFRAAGISGGFHEAAAWVFELLSKSELATEKRADMVPGRRLEEAVEVFMRALLDDKLD